jgi:hypothetical protein
MTGRMTGRMDEKDDHHHRNRTKCRGGRGVGPLVAACWPSLQPWLGHQAFHPVIYILRLPACSSPSLNFLLFSLLPLISFKKPLLCTIIYTIGLLFFVIINSTFRVRLAGTEWSASSFFCFSCIALLNPELKL